MNRSRIAVLCIGLFALAISVSPNAVLARTSATASRQAAAPVFSFPTNGTSYPSNGPYVFQVQPLSGVTGYLWSFVQNGMIVYQNLAWDGHLSSANYTASTVSKAHSLIHPGDLHVWVRALMRNGQWSATGAVLVRIQGKGGPRRKPTVVPQPTSKPQGNILYQANWSQGLDGWPGSSGWSVVGGMLVSTGKQDGVLLAPYQPGDASIANYAVEAEIQWVNGNNFGLAVRTDSSGNGGYHAALAYNQAAIWVGQNAPVQQSYTPDSGWHTYRVTVQDNHVTFSIDGGVVDKLTDNGYLSGGGVGVFSYNGTQINVRSFKVIAL